MKWITGKRRKGRLLRRCRGKGGFTLIEVLVALAIASGALVLILSANAASLKKSVHSRLEERMVRVAESKLSEWQAGTERATEGTLPGFQGHSWAVRTAEEPMPPLKKMVRITIRITGPDGSPILQWSVLHHPSRGEP